MRERATTIAFAVVGRAITIIKIDNLREGKQEKKQRTDTINIAKTD